MDDPLLDQFTEFVSALNAMNEAGAFLVTGDSMKEDYQQYLGLVDHVLQLWSAGRTLYLSGHFPQAVYLAIAAIEEVGKIGVVRFQVFLREAARERGEELSVGENRRSRENPFFSHPKKHLLAAGGGALINRRLRRILGEDAICNFLNQVRSGEIERIRQTALYVDVAVSGAQLPSGTFGEADARFFVVLAGELMAEILGLAPDQFEKLLGIVQQFEQEIGHRWE
ncbi:MAG: AbiV family abortive infection protein [Planctomycetes bacterium]|nr:AbiV family abortive infection protein [Planctomycetota bacterium]